MTNHNRIRTKSPLISADCKRALFDAFAFVCTAAVILALLIISVAIA